MSKAFPLVAGLRMLSQLSVAATTEEHERWGLENTTTLFWRQEGRIKVSQGSVPSRGLLGRILPASFSFWRLRAVAAFLGLLCLHRSSLKNKIKPKQGFNS